MFTFFTVPTDYLTQIGSISGSFFTDFAPIIYLILGVILIGVVINLIIHALKK
jgi:hypothetical protein